MNEVKNLIAQLLEYATKQGADLHICPKSAPFVRLGGKFGELEQVPGFDDCQLDLATVKVLVGELLTPEQKGELQKNNYLDFTFTHGELGRFRAYAYTQRGTHAITIHTLPFEIPDFLDLDFTAEAAYNVEKITVEDEKGLIIVSGDCFSNKEKTLAMLVDLMNCRGHYHISTIEKPIEYLHRHKNSFVVQKEVGADVPDFSTALNQIRHEAPDVVMVSELRQEDLLSVMELAEERLVFAGLKVNIIQDNSAEKVIKAVGDIIHTEAARKNLISPFIPNPRISIIYQEQHDGYLHGELITWDMYEDDGMPVTPIIYGGEQSEDGAVEG